MFNDISKDFFEIPLDMEYIITESKSYFRLKEKKDNFQQVKYINKETLFSDFMNFNFYQFRKGVEKFVFGCIDGKNKEDLYSEINRLNEMLENIPFIFGAYSVFFIVRELIEVSVDLFKDCDMDDKQFEECLKILISIIFEYYKINPKSGGKLVFLTEGNHVTVDNKKEFGGIKPCIEMGIEMKKRPDFLKAYKVKNRTLVEARNVCFDIYSEWKAESIKRGKLKQEEKIYLLNKLVDARLGREWVIWKKAQKKCVAIEKTGIIENEQVYDFRDFGEVVTWVLSEAIRNTSLEYCSICCKIFNKKSNRQIYCEDCKSLHLPSSIKKKVEYKDASNIKKKKVEYKDADNIKKEENLESFIQEIDKYQEELSKRKINIAEYYKKVSVLREEYGCNPLDTKYPGANKLKGSKSMVPIFRGYNVTPLENE